jgi:hypothetical protein
VRDLNAPFSDFVIFSLGRFHYGWRFWKWVGVVALVIIGIYASLIWYGLGGLIMVGASKDAHGIWLVSPLLLMFFIILCLGVREIRKEKQEAILSQPLTISAHDRVLAAKVGEHSDVL